MKSVECWHWQLRSETSRTRSPPRGGLISEAEARQRDPNAVRVPGTLVVRELPETSEEKAIRQRIFDVNPNRARGDA